MTLDGRMLASSDSTDGGFGTQMVELPDLTGVDQGEVIRIAARDHWLKCSRQYLT